MRTHIVLGTLALVALCAVTVAAADVSGKWVAQVPGRGGDPMEVTFNLKAAGDKVTGTVSTQFGDQDISEGKVSGDDIAFATVLEFGDNKVKFSYKGKVAGNEMKLTREMQFSGPPPGDGFPPAPKPVEFTAKKVG